MAVPTTTTRSDGTKVTLYPALSGSAVDYAIGVEAGSLWSSIPGFDAGQSFKWYGGTTQVAALTGQGVFTVTTLTPTNPISVTYGGTGASTVAGAQTNLQVDPAGTAIAMAIALG